MSDSHVEAVRRDLGAMPNGIATSTTAIAALGLAKTIDELPVRDLFRFQSALVAQLRDCMSELTTRAAALAESTSGAEGDASASVVSDLASRIAARRGAATG